MSRAREPHRGRAARRVGRLEARERLLAAAREAAPSRRWRGSSPGVTWTALLLALVGGVLVARSSKSRRLGMDLLAGALGLTSRR